MWPSGGKEVIKEIICMFSKYKDETYSACIYAKYHVHGAPIKTCSETVLLS